MAAASPPASPLNTPRRPASAMMRPAPRSSSRLSISSKNGVGSRASDDEARTAVKVAVRVRPPLKPSDPGFDLIPQRFQRSMVQTTSNTSLAIDSPHGRKIFVFDRVFSPDVMQEGVWDYLGDSINSFTQGYNVSLLAYGQSGAGKSFTMGTSGPGDQETEELMGVVPRAAAALFDKLIPQNFGPNGAGSIPMSSSMSQLKTPRAYGQQSLLGDRNWSLKATYVEIYNEQLRDLLVPEATPAHERTNIAIREDAKGNILLTGLRQVDINSVDDLLNALHFGSTIRQTDATAINAKSSRSHAVFSLNLIQRKTKLQTATGREKRFSVPLEAMTGQDMAVTTDSKLHFVDLAGSERLKNTGAQGERAKEGISINAGLASLGKVISQLSSRQSGSHVSYRDSKLTRLLQDSLGGNAITYMIACVTPAEFHLSETLNTVQYAQRARAIQSKPRIQQIDEAGDSKALIERLRAEVAFLREQIHSSQARSGSPRRGNGTAGDRTDRHNERESELQNQLLDSQENYNALSQRHAKLIAELARARETESENAGEVDMASDSATDRLNRSNSFAQAVEQVVLEYEKTIETLEQSLTSTRSTLSNSETVLLEKETRCAYVETINTQLQTRVQKLMDRESNTESYLHDLEAKLDGHTTGDEKNATVMTELRKELARIRENEAASEDYISTLEERLAEADQDAELMQREIDRLEQVVERQRSLGKLDALLHELDNVDQGRSPIADSREPNGIAPGSSTGHGRTMSHMSRKSQFDEPIPEEAEDVGDGTAELKITEAEETTAADGDVEDATATPSVADDSNGDLPRQSPAQSKFVADKLENVTQELIDLRVEHESTVTDYDHLQAKYEDAMKNLAELQDAVDEARHGDSAARNRDSVASGPSDAENTRDSYSTGTKSKDGPRSSMSRSLSSELSSAMESPATVDTSTADMESDDETATTKPTESSEDLSQQASNEQELAAEIRRLRKLADDKEAAEKNLADKYAELEETHSETLDIVEELKTEVSKARAVEATSPRQSTPVIRRKSSQNLMIIDRAHRSFASLRNIASENFEQNPEVMQNFELNLNSAMHELHSRSERIQELEADITSVKKEMETKMTIISGLTRERSSLKASPMDISMVANLRGQLEQNEKQLAVMRATHAAREEELTGELVKVREALGDGATPTPETGNDVTQEREHKISDLEAQLAVWENKHNQATTAAEENEQSLRDTIQQLEAKVAATEASMASSTAMAKSSDDEAARETEKKQKALAEFLRSEIDEYKAIINSNTAKIAELDKTHSAAKARLGALTETHESATKQLTEHQELVASLESKIADHATAMEALKTGHAKELAGLKADEQNSYEEQAGVLMQEHTEATHKLEAELAAAREQLDKVAAQVGEGMGIDVGVDQLSEQIARLLADQKALVEEQRKAEELKSHVAELTSINETMVTDAETTKSTLAEMLSGSNEAVPGTVALQLASVKRRLDDLDGRNKKNSRLVEELEEQLQNNFDEAQVTNNRLSTLQSERNSQLDDAVAVRTRLQSDLDSIREEYSSLQAKYQDLSNTNDGKRSSSNSIIRKSASHTSLPSPPPAIPLPPLPTSISARSGSPTNGIPPTSPTTARPMSKDNSNISQLTEDQEARIRTFEKHLYAERQLTQTLEEALTDLEKQSKKVKSDCDAWKKRAQDLESELKELKDKPQADTQHDNRWSMQVVEEERKKRQAAELARKQLEDRMNAINKNKKKKGSLNCF